MAKYPKIVPFHDWVYVKKQSDANETKEGILLPSNCKIPNTRARVISVGPMTRRFPWGEPLESNDAQIRPGDMVILHFGTDCQPVDIEDHNGLMLVPGAAIIAKVPMTNDAMQLELESCQEGKK